MKAKRQFSAHRAPIAAVIVAAALIAVPAAATQTKAPYSDASGDNGSAGDVTGVTVAGDQSSGLLVFRITGTNLSTSANSWTFLNIDSDANPLTGDILSGGADYGLEVNDGAYGFFHWNGSDWVFVPVDIPVVGGGNELIISMNAKNVGNPAMFNFSADTFDTTTKSRDHAPDVGMFNYLIAAGGPDIRSIELTSTPAGRPRAGKKFTVTPTGLTLPPTGTTDVPKPDSYSCKATLKAHALAGRGTGGCTFSVPKNSRRKSLNITVTVSYEGASKSFPYHFPVR